MAATLALFDTAALREMESRARAGFSGDAFEPMRRAGEAGWRALLRDWPQAQRIVVVCGPGNNGGDGYVLALHAHQAGRDVSVLRLETHAPRTELARRAEAGYAAARGRIVVFEATLPPCDMVVDALFGIGLTRAPDDETAALIEAIERLQVPVLSLDVPSGIDADTGDAPGVAVYATRTLQFIAAHVGLYTGDALDHAGVREVAPLELPAQAGAGIAAAARLLRPQALAGLLSPRRRNSHKGMHGRVLCIGGDAGMGGAIVLCAEAALRTGAGMVSVATHPEHVAAVFTRIPECMTAAFDDAENSETFAARLRAADVLAVGPGLGRREWGRALLDAALSSGKPAVFDADALNLLAAAPRALRNAVITPHPGEAARLLGIDTAAVQANRPVAATRLAAAFACTVVLKGAGSVVAAPGHTLRVIDAGNPGMAVAGTGDVLTGVIAALRAQGLDAFDAANGGALLHAHAGDIAARDGERGLLASDLIACLRAAANPSSSS